MTYTIGALNSNTTYSGTIVDSVGGGGTTAITKTGSGSLWLNGANTNSGLTTLSGGTLGLGNSLALQNSTLNDSSGTLSFGTLTAATLGGLQGANSLGLSNVNSAAVALSVGNNGSTTTFGGSLTGNGSLVKIGAGTLVLNGSNTYSNGTTISAGVLQFTTAAGSLPTSGNVTIQSGGALAANGAYSSAAAWVASGKIATASNGVLAVMGNDNSTVNLSGGTLNSLSLGSVSGSTFSGTITPGASGYQLGGGGGQLTVASNALAASSSTLNVNGSVSLTASQTYTGPTVIGAGGTLLLGTAPTAIPATGLAYALDASLKASLTLSGGTVSSWNDISGNGVNFSNSSPSALPTYVASGINGLGSVNFNGSTGLLYSSKSATVQTVFIVSTPNSSQVSLGGIWGQNGQDNGIRLNNSTAWQNGASTNGNDFSHNGTMYLNGMLQTGNASFTSGTPQILEAIGSGANNWTTAVGCYTPQYGRYYNAQIGKVLVYSGSLSPAASQAIEAALAAKWTVTTPAVGNNLLPITTTVNLSAATATFDLGYNNQAVASLSGVAGSIVSVGAGALLTTGGGNTSTTFAGSLVGNGGLVKTGSGSFTLSGSDMYTGTTAINGGSIVQGSNFPLSAFGSLTVASTAARGLDMAGFNTTVNGLFGTGTVGSSSGSPTLTVGNVGGTATFSGVIQDAVNLVKAGSGTQTLSGTDTYVGSTTIAAGTLQLGSSTALPSTTPLTVNGTAVRGLDLAGYNATIGAISGTGAIGSSLGSPALTIGNGGGSGTFSGTIQDSLALVKSGSGTQFLSSTDSYAGGTTITGGVLQFGTGAASVPSTPATGSIVINGGALSTAGPAGLNTAAAWLASGKIAASPTGTLALAANENSALNFSGGTLNNLSLGAIAAATFSGTITPGGNGYLLGGGGGTLTLGSSALNAAANLTVNGNLVMASTQSYTGNTTLAAGVLQLAAAENAGNGGPLGIGGGITFAGGTLQYSAANAYDYSGRFTAAANQPYTVNTNGQNVTWGSALTSSGGSLTKLGNGTLTLGGANSYGGTTLISAGTLALANGQALQNSTLNTSGAGALSFGSLTAATFGGVMNGGNLSLSNTAAAGVALSVGGNGATTTYSGLLGGNGSFFKTGAGMLTLTANNSYAGGTTINAGTLSVGSVAVAGTGGVASPLGASSNAAANLTFNNGTLLYTGTGGTTDRNFTVSNGGTGTISVASAAANLTLTGGAAASGAGTLVKAGPGTLTLAAANAQTGGFTVSGGTVQVTAAQTYSGPTIIAAGATLYVPTAPAAPVAGTLLYDLDASNSANFALSSGSVTTWNDSSPNHYAFNLSSASAPTYATSGSNTIDGHPTVVFNGANSNQLRLTTALTPITLFYVTQTTGYNMLNTLVAPNDTGDGGFRMASATSWNIAGDTNDFTTGAGGAVYINGVQTNSFTAGQPYVLDAYRGASYTHNNTGTNIGGVYSGRFYYGNVGEILAYSTSLSTANRQADEAYLNAKWLNIGTSGGANLLPTSSPIILGGSGATLNLGYESQTVASISGSSAGSSVVFGPDPNAPGGVLTTGGDNTSTTFAGSIVGAGSLVKTGTGAFVLSGSNAAFTGSTTIGSGALQLGDGVDATAFPTGNIANNAALTFANPNAAIYGGVISGSGGVTVAGPGLLTFGSASHTYSGGTTLSGGTLSVGALGIAGSGGTPGALGASSNAAANLLFQGGSLLYTGTGATTDRNFTMNNSNATIGVSSSAANLTLTGGAAANSVGTLVKAGPGTLTLAGSNAQTGGLTVSGGTVTVSAIQAYTGATVIAAGATLYVPAAPSPVQSGLLYDLDASTAAGLTTTGGTVTSLNDVSGHGNNFTGTITSGPTVLSGSAGINGRTAVHFGGASTATNQLLLNNSTTPESIFIIDRVTTAHSNNDGIWGQLGDFGIRSTGNYWYYQNGSNSNDYAQPAGSTMSINGVPVAAGAERRVHPQPGPAPGGQQSESRRLGPDRPGRVRHGGRS